MRNNFELYFDFVQETQAADSPDPFNDPINRSILQGILELVSEVGEVVELGQKSTRRGLTVEKDLLYDELSDVLWCVQSLLVRMGSGTLEDLIQYNISKLTLRRRVSYDQ